MYKREGYRNPIPTTDIIIEYSDGAKDGIVLVERKNPPYGLAIPGGFAEYGLELHENAAKEAKEETNLEIIITEPNKPFLVSSKPDRDPRAHMISICYIAQGQGHLRAGDDAAQAYLFSHDEVQELIDQNKLAFDHGMILQSYLDWRKTQ